MVDIDCHKQANSQVRRKYRSLAGDGRVRGVDLHQLEDTSEIQRLVISRAIAT